VFAYSRPGYGDSDSPTTPRDAKHIVEELRGLLAAEGYAPPYILVGHSFGGTYMELFAKSHPSEVAGLVLVDTRHRDFLATCEAAKFELCGIPADAVSSLPQVQQDEYVAFAMASPEIRAAGAFGSYPVRVLTATDHGNSAAKEALWESMLGALAAEAADGKQIVFPGSGHYIQLDRTSGVVDAIVAVLPAGVH
jgi:pimeloyl-ACP methyl ester carboxylesterase